jgi:hypothetical protein
MGIAIAVACAEELVDELTAEMARACGERLILKTLDGVKIEGRLAERRAFEERGNALQTRLRGLIREAAIEAGISPDGEDVATRLAQASPEAAVLADRIGAIRALAAQLSEVNTFNKAFAERALACTRAFVRTLAPRPSAYDRHGSEPAPEGALGSISRRA